MRRWGHCPQFMHLLNGMFYKIIKIRCQQIWTKPQYHMMEVLRLLTYHYSFRNFSESILCSRWERFIGQNLIYSRKGWQHIQQSDQVLREKKSSTKHFNSGRRKCLCCFKNTRKDIENNFLAITDQEMEAFKMTCYLFKHTNHKASVTLMRE